MTHIGKIMILAAGLIAAVPAWAQGPAASYSFAPASGSEAGAPEPRALRAPGAEALRWLGGLGSTRAEPEIAPMQAGGADRGRRR